MNTGYKISPVCRTIGELWVSLIGYVLIYGLLAGATVYLLKKYAQAGPAATDGAPEPPEIAPSLLGAD